MEGFRIAGKCFCVCEDLRRIAIAHKGWTVEQYLRLLKIEKVEKGQFGGKNNEN